MAMKGKGRDMALPLTQAVQRPLAQRGAAVLHQLKENLHLLIMQNNVRMVCVLCKPKRTRFQVCERVQGDCHLPANFDESPPPNAQIHLTAWR